MNSHQDWPALDYSQWQGTRQTLQLWLQMMGKVRASLTPWTNHAWHSTLFVSPRGLTTGLVPAHHHSFSIELDLIERRLRILTSAPDSRELDLRDGETVSVFHGRFRKALTELGVTLCYSTRPDEVADPIQFDLDQVHCSFDADAALAFWRALIRVERVLTEFRSRFVGKCSPVHFFWGSMDLAVTRFSGRVAPEHPGGVPGLADAIVREAYSHEVSSCGFWPGDARFPEAAFYSYAYPAPEGFGASWLEPASASFNPLLREFVLPYVAVRSSDSPVETLLSFLESTYQGAARLGHWDRKLLESSVYLDRLKARQRKVCGMADRRVA